MKSLLEAMQEEIELGVRELPGGFRSNKYVSIYHLPPGWINKKVAKLNAKGEAIKAPAGKTVAQVVYEAFPGPLKIFQNQVFGKAIDIPYNEHFHAVTRSLYPMLRFYFSPRFLALNMGESKFIGIGLGGKEFFKEADPLFYKFAKEMEEYKRPHEVGFL